jgi:muramoyltetrapeptide carboxypeptidase
MKYPSPLIKGSKIAITAFSSGVPEELHQRLDIVISNLKKSGFDVVEGNCLRENIKHVSSSSELRAQELMKFLCDETISAIAPPWGGEFAMDILPLLDYERLKTVKPKWIFGYSDVSTIAVALMTKLGWSTVHCSNLMELLSLFSVPLNLTKSLVVRLLMNLTVRLIRLNRPDGR